MTVSRTHTQTHLCQPGIFVCHMLDRYYNNIELNEVMYTQSYDTLSIPLHDENYSSSDVLNQQMQMIQRVNLFI